MIRVSLQEVGSLLTTGGHAKRLFSDSNPW
jgi:hypothetical protein